MRPTARREQTAELSSFINLSDELPPFIELHKLISLCNFLKNIFNEMSPLLSEVGTKDGLSCFADFNKDIRFSIDRKLYSAFIDNTPELHQLIRDITGGGILSGCFLYPPDGFMGWHTNSSKYPRDDRLYLTYNDKVGSKFHYRKDGQIRFIEEPIGWSIKFFSVNDTFWHAVESNSRRYSFGFRYVAE